MLEVAMNELKKAAEEFYNITNVKIVLWDDERRCLYSYPDTMCDFCEMVRTNDELSKKCLNCDKIGFDECDRTGEPYVYKCHMNLYEAVAPIKENGVIIGYMMIGQMLNRDSLDEVIRQSGIVAEKYGFDSEKMQQSLDGCRVVDEEFISSCMSIVSMCICYLYYNQIIKNRTDILTYQLADFVETHLCEKINVEYICQKMYISKSKLYQLSLAAFGMGVTDYIRMRRIEKAQKMLETTSYNVSVIAEKCGFDDANYFTRMFKNAIGVTPTAYRKHEEIS
ncbi:MAG: PocR ligand-binding domain-containing protein [Clostridia bacterium]|nr:PocR ligand-binding domain-containing protein [Clostridia bacterium]